MTPAEVARKWVISSTEFVLSNLIDFRARDIGPYAVLIWKGAVIGHYRWPVADTKAKRVYRECCEKVLVV